MSTTFTPIQEIGREKLIEKLKAYKGAEVSNVLYGTGDDAAVFKSSPGTLQLISSDSFGRVFWHGV